MVPRFPFRPARWLAFTPIAVLPFLAALVLRNDGVWFGMSLMLGVWVGWHTASEPGNGDGSP